MKIFSNFRPDTCHTYDEFKKVCKDKPITLFYDYVPKSLDQLNINPYNFIILVEPNEFFGLQSWVLQNSHLFTGIITWNDTLFKDCSNAIFFHYIGDGGAGDINHNYLEDFNDKYPTKKFEVSFLCGAKRLVEGHKFRQEIYKIEDKITIPKKWFYTLKDFDVENFNKGGIGRPDDIWVQKQICYQESMFHIGVENVKYNNWCTEKICDAFATKTVPIYWGCPNLEELGYDERGIIRFNSADELVKNINNLTPDDYYNRLPYIEHNYKMIRNFRFKNVIARLFKDFITENNI